MDLELSILSDEVKTISVDFFDTLFLRDCIIPTDIFERIEAEYGIKDFSKSRIIAEKRARSKKLKEDINLQEIYQNFQCSQKDKKKYIEIEIKEELKALRPNQNLAHILKKASESNKSLILLSDSYLDINFFKTVLKRHDLDFFDHIFISSDYRLTKATGNLFKATEKFGYFSSKKELNKEILHIGDNIVADNKMPKKLGISVFFLPSMNDVLRSKCKFLFHKNQFNDFEKKFLSFYCERNYELLFSNSDIPKLNHFVATKITPLLFFHFNYLKNLFDSNNPKSICLAYRDGYVLEKIFSNLGLYQEKIKKVYITRNMRVLASIENFSDLVESFKEYPISEISMKDFLIKRVGVKKERVIGISETLKLGDINKICLFNDLNLSILKENFDYLMMPENSTLNEIKNYLNQFNKNSSFFWDIGYRGSIEKFYKNQNISYVQLFNFSFLKESRLTKSQFEVKKETRLKSSVLLFFEEILRENNGSVYGISEEKFLREEHQNDSKELEKAREILIKEVTYYIKSLPVNNKISNIDQIFFEEILKKFNDRNFVIKLTDNIEFIDSTFLGQNKFNNIKYITKNFFEKLFYKFNEKINKKH